MPLRSLDLQPSDNSRDSTGFVVQVPSTVPPSFTGEVLDMLQLLGVHIYTDQKLWSQLCRITHSQIRFYHHQVSMEADGDGSATQELEAVSI